MNSSQRVSLDETFHLLQLVRETALARSKQAQGSDQQEMAGLANRLEPVVDKMKELNGTNSKGETRPSASAGILGQADFQRLLETRRSAAGGGGTTQTNSTTNPATNPLSLLGVQGPANQSSAVATGGPYQAGQAARSEGPSLSNTIERNRMIAAMASANMSEVDIARQFGMSRDEVRLVLNVQQKTPSSNEVIR